MIQKELMRYEIFSEAYFGRKGEFKGIRKEEIKHRADGILGEDVIYRNILKLGRPVKKEDFIPHVEAELGREDLGGLKKAKENGEFDGALRENIIRKQAEKQGWEMAGNLGIEVINDGKICLPHLPRIAESWQKTILGVKESLGLFVNLLRKKEKFKNVEKIEAMSWIFGQKMLAKDLDELIGWHSYTEEETKKFRKENPELYQDAQRTGIKLSPRLFREYLLTGEVPEIGGRWITKKEFIENMTHKKK